MFNYDFPRLTKIFVNAGVTQKSFVALTQEKLVAIVARLFYTLFFLTYSFCYGQNLKNTDWIRIKSERKDGSRIIDRSHLIIPFNIPLKYTFRDTVLITSYDGEFTTNFKVTDQILSIGYSEKNKFFITSRFQIDSLSKILLVLTELPEENLRDDKINRFYFIKSRYYFEYLLRNDKIVIKNDSLIECNQLLFPYYKGNIDIYLTKKLSPIRGKSLVTGYFLFAPDGNIKELNIDKVDNLSDVLTHKLKEVLLSTDGSWKLPEMTKKFYLKMNFACSLTNEGNWSGYSGQGWLSKVTIRYNIKDTTALYPPPLSVESIQSISQHYKKGLRFLEQNKYESAIEEFSNCIEIDSLNIDSYYNKAYAYFKLNQSKLACENWKKLKELGQKQGGQLFSENCK